jgi:hypothetical protein
MAGARQRETAARQEAGGAEPENLPSDCPSAVSETAGASHGHTSTHAHNSTDEWSGRRVRPRNIRPCPDPRPLGLTA